MLRNRPGTNSQKRYFEQCFEIVLNKLLIPTKPPKASSDLSHMIGEQWLHKKSIGLREA
jgi:hypothetical protein